MELVEHTARKLNKNVERDQSVLIKEGAREQCTLRNKSETNYDSKIIDVEDPVSLKSNTSNTRPVHTSDFSCSERDSKCDEDIHVILTPRSETIVPIPIAADVDNINILILKQEVIQDVYCASVMNKVENGYTLVSIMNISEVEKKLQVKDLNTIQYEPEVEYQTYTINNTAECEERMQKITNMIRCEHMNLEEKGSIMEICRQYSAIFHLDGDQLTYTNAMEHEIKLPENQTPIYRRPYRLPFAQQNEINSQITKMITDDIIEPSKSPWNAPLLLVKKKLDATGVQKYRIVVDFRALNKVTINEFHPLPNITEILDQLGQSQLFSVIDLASGFYQIPLAESSRECTAFSTLQGHWQFKRMVMGMKTSPATSQRLMNNVLTGMVGIKCLVYLDDIIVYGKNLADHNEKLREVFTRLLENNLKIQPDKCEFLKRECLYLGHVITEDGIKPDPDKIKAVLEFPVPKTVKNIKSFLGLSGYYRKFIQGYSAIAKPITHLLKKDVTFNWTKECQGAFDKLRTILCTEPIL